MCNIFELLVVDIFKNVNYHLIMKTTYLDPNLYNKIYSILQYSNALALRVSLETGLRIDDVLKLKKSDLKGRTITGVAEKTGKKFKKVLSADLTRRLKEVGDSVWFFPHRFKTDDHRTRQTVWKDVKKAVKILKLGGNVAPHSARKTYAVELFKDSGIDKVQKELQHDNTSTTMLYAFADILQGSARNTPDIDSICEKIAEKTAALLEKRLNL